jgi:hypothetical protein
MANELPAFRGLLVKYEQFFLSQVQQTAACNAFHTVQARTCKWLLRMHELAGSDLPLTQDFLAQMMGVRRASVTGDGRRAAQGRNDTYSRGRNPHQGYRTGTSLGCECDADVRSHYRRIFESNEADVIGFR